MATAVTAVVAEEVGEVETTTQKNVVMEVKTIETDHSGKFISLTHTPN